MARIHEIDFEAEGFLDGIDGVAQRAARRQLVGELLDAGVELDEIRRAAAEGRLATLPLEQVYASGCTYTVRDVIDRVGLTEEFVRRNLLSLGLPFPDPDELAFSEEDMEAWRMIKLLLDTGLDEDAIFALGRVGGRNAVQVAEAVLETFTRTYAREGDTERDFGLRIAEVARNLEPALAPLMATPARMHLRQRTRNEAVVQLERVTGELPDTREAAICFADLVGFTSLTERVEVLELGEVTARLERLAGECAEPPVRLVKLIGDAAMFVSPDPVRLVETAAALVDRTGADEALPPLRVGMAAGHALNRGGDWYGRPVNLAARIAAIAEPGSVFADASVAAGTSHRIPWRPRPARQFKGIASAVELFALER